MKYQLIYYICNQISFKLNTKTTHYGQHNKGKCPVMPGGNTEGQQYCNGLVAQGTQYGYFAPTRHQGKSAGREFNYAEEFKNLI